MTIQGGFGGVPATSLAVVSADANRSRRLGRAILYLSAQSNTVSDQMLRARLGSLLFAGQCMEFAARLRGLSTSLSPEVAAEFAMRVGINGFDLRTRALPVLKAADVIDFTVVGDQVTGIDEFVGVTGTLIEQGMNVLKHTSPTQEELAVLHSIELASWAPLTARDHVDELIRRGFSEQDAASALTLAAAFGVTLRAQSAALNDDVIYNPNVWGAQMSSVATFLHKLGPNERAALLGVVEMASDRPGLALRSYSDVDASVLASARKVGLVQAAEVRSSLGGSSSQTYVFSPLIESVDDTYASSEALHERKLFVAHMLYGHERAQAGRGVIYDPRVLVRAMLRKDRVGPASNITTDYHLLEARGIVTVSSAFDDRSYLNAVKKDVISSGLTWLESALDSDVSGGSESLKLLQTPGQWQSPEMDRAQLTSVAGAAREVTESAVLELRSIIKEAQRVSRNDF